MTTREKEVSFEEAFQQLEALAQRLESGEVPLEESIQAYEQGVKLLISGGLLTPDQLLSGAGANDNFAAAHPAVEPPDRGNHGKQEET